MRIIAGAFRGHALSAPKGEKTRPTTDRTREALFNVLAHGGHTLEGARVLDLFAGSGALGLEALSRGGAFALFVEEAPAPRGAIRQNIEALSLQGRTRIFRRDATKLGTRPAAIQDPFDLVFCDPPYGRGFVEQALASALGGNWLAAGALVVAEHAKADILELPPGLTPEDARDYGDTRVSFLRVV